MRRLLLLIASAIVLTSCTSSDPGTVRPVSATPPRCRSVVYVVSGRMNSPAPGLTAAMSAAASRAVRRGAPIGLVNLDGTPQLMHMAAFSDPGANSLASQQAQQSFLGSFSSAIKRTRATSPHANVLGALNLAGRAIHGECSRGGTIYLEDSGLQETGPLDFRQPGTLSADPGDTVRFLRREHELPNLDGITVVLTGIGDTAPPQPPLSTAQQDNLTAIWKAIATAGGAAAVPVSTTPRTGIPAPAHVPAVLLVPVPDPPAWRPSQPRHIFPDSGPLGFEPNTTTFRDPAAAVAALRPIARYLAGNRSARIELTGTTAHWGTFAGCLRLSRQRADAVKTLLEHLHARSGQIRTSGLGWRFSGYVNDQGPDGTLLPGPAEQNRSVIVTQE